MSETRWARRVFARVVGRAAVLALSAGFLSEGSLGADPSGTSVFRPASTPAGAIHDYSLFVLAVTAAIFAVVFTLIVIALVRFRRRPGDDASEPPQIYGSDQVEVAWTVIPILIVIVLSLTTARTVFEVQGRERPAGALEVTAIGRQWWWEFRYPASASSRPTSCTFPSATPRIRRRRS